MLVVYYHLNIYIGLEEFFILSFFHDGDGIDITNVVLNSVYGSTFTHLDSSASIQSPLAADG